MATESAIALAASGLLCAGRPCIAPTSDMTLRTKIILSSTLTVFAVLAFSEWLSYRHTIHFISMHEQQMLRTGGHAAAIGLLRDERARLIADLTSLHVLHAGVTVLALIAVLNVLWSRLFVSPLRRLLDQIRIMGLGTWTSAVPVLRDDELGELTRAFNHLGLQLSTTVHDFATTSRLSAMALLGHQIVRRIALTGDHLAAIRAVLDTAAQNGQRVPEAAIHNLDTAIRNLGEVSARFEAEFDREFTEARRQPGDPAFAVDARK